MGKHQYMSLSEIARYEPDMERLGVSEVARSKSGFLPVFKRTGGNPEKLSDHWRRKREAFLARHLVQYRANPTPRRRLALIAWAYMP
jgi:hypothetical protein